MKKFALIFLFLIVSFNGFSQEIINPSQGKWANKQVLVLDVPAGGNAFYSLNGSNPETSGFAYDGPVLIDLTGDIKLSVVIINHDGEKTTKDILFSVEEQTVNEELDFYSFINDISSKCVIEYTAGSSFEIPSSLEYAMGNSVEIYEQGTSLSISADSIFSRYIPCSVYDGTNKWRFVIKIIPTVSGVFSRKDVPFEIDDWDNITFNDRKMIYKVDNQWWEQPKLPLKIDRTVSHMISWQEIDYSNENPVNFYVLPAKPEVVHTVDKSGVVSLKFDGEEGYKFGLLNENNQTFELFDFVTLDTFQGDSYSGQMEFGIFYDSVYQGKYELSFNIHKKNPTQPKFAISDEMAVYRDTLAVKIQDDFNNQIFYSISGPVILTQEDYSDAAVVLTSFDSTNYLEYKNNLLLEPLMDGAAIYKVFAYCVDSYGNKSKVIEKSFIIDQCNYYIDERNTNENPDGSKNNPFNSFEQCIKVLNKTRYANIRVFGDVKFPEGKTLFASNCEITGFDNARLIFPENSSVAVRNSSFVLKNCLLDHKGFSRTKSTFFELDHSVLDFYNCELVSSFFNSGTIFNSNKSVVVINDCGITIKSKNYASVISSLDSKISVDKSRFSSISNTSVVFSLQGGIFDVSNSECKIFGNLGRIAELFDTQSSLCDNVFSAELTNPKGVSNPIYKDSKNVTVKESGNIVIGF